MNLQKKKPLKGWSSRELESEIRLSYCGRVEKMVAEGAAEADIRPRTGELWLRRFRPRHFRSNFLDYSGLERFCAPHEGKL